MRSPATPVPYARWARQRTKRIGSKGIFGAFPSQVFQSRFSGDRPGGGIQLSQAPLGLFRPVETSIERTSPIAPDAISSLALIDVQVSAAPLPISTMRLFFSAAAIIANPSATS